MGLDSVELVLAFEEAFGVAISDGAAEKMATPGGVIDFMCAQRGPGTAKLCLSRRAFHVVRRRLIEAGHLRKTVRPDAALDEFFPDGPRQQLWPRLRGDFSVRQWPELVRPDWLVRIAFLTIMAVAVAVAILTARSSEVGVGILSAYCTLIFLAPATVEITCRFQKLFPGMRTVGDLAVRIAKGGTTGLLNAGEEMDRATIAAIVRQITLEQTGTNPGEYGEDKSFVEDFGID